jgi:hypothetical protein
MRTEHVNVEDLQVYLQSIKPEEWPAVLKMHLAQVWDEGLDFAGAALRGGCSLDEAGAVNPYR